MPASAHRKPPEPPPRGFRVLETSTSRVERFDTESQQYLTWLLAPAGEDKLSDYIQRHGSYEYDLIRIAIRLLPQNGTFLDVGASIGPWALALAKERKDARVEAFEPNWHYYHQLAGNIFLNNLQNVHAHRFALGARQASARLHLPDSTRRAEGTLIPGTGRAMQEVPVGALDDLPLKPDVIKIDAQGYEHEVIEGGWKTIDAEKPILFFESWDPMKRGDQVRARRTALLAMLETELGYSVRQLDTASHEDFIAYPPSRHDDVDRAMADEKALK